MKNLKLNISFLLLFVLIGMQFVRPNKNINSGATSTDLLRANRPTPEVANLIKKTCYDCHSNQTQSYWYSNIVPMAWLMDSNVREGREKLNFSEWEAYGFDQKVDLAGAIMFQMYDGKMPVEEYLWMHEDARLTKAEQNKITEWINTLVE